MTPENQRHSQAWLPLPKGEGRGEGEQRALTGTTVRTLRRFQSQSPQQMLSDRLPFALQCTPLHCNARLPGTRGSSSLAHSPQSQCSGHRGKLRQIAANRGKKSFLHSAVQSLHILLFALFCSYQKYSFPLFPLRPPVQFPHAPTTLPPNPGGPRGLRGLGLALARHPRSE